MALIALLTARRFDFVIDQDSGGTVRRVRRDVRS
jgi:hypothetical protein